MVKILYEVIFDEDSIEVEGLFDENLTTTELIMELEDIIHYNWNDGRLGKWRVVNENLA